MKVLRKYFFEGKVSNGGFRIFFFRIEFCFRYEIGRVEGWFLGGFFKIFLEVLFFFR